MLDDYQAKFLSVAPSQNISFQCKKCGKCCRNVYNSVPIESLDAYRIAKYLREENMGIQSVEDFLDKYTVPVFLSDSGYLAFMLKTIGDEHSCIFLKNNRCRIHKTKPRACRTYPFSATPNLHYKGRFDYFVSIEYSHHFKSKSIETRRWMNQYFSKEDREFVTIDFGSVIEIEKTMRKISEKKRLHAIMIFIKYKYSNFNLDEPFLPQFQQNNSILIQKLQKMID